MNLDLQGVLRARYPALLAEREPEISCGDGWFDIVDGLLAQITATGIPAAVRQIKEKFGGLRCYVAAIGDTDNAIGALVRAAEDQAYRTCERCGEPGEYLVADHYWMTVCDEHRPAGEVEVKRPPKWVVVTK